LFIAGTTFSHTFEKEGTFDYFYIVHPWMVGSIIIGEVSAKEDLVLCQDYNHNNFPFFLFCNLIFATIIATIIYASIFKLNF